MGYLKQIDIENFKSWRGKTVLGPFMRFNCIIGTNGSGKSNVMDALSFAMGERAASLRVKHLRDLVHGAHIGQPVQETSSVALRYCDDEDRETVFCRTIAGDSTEYHVNGTHVTFDKYIQELEKIGVVSKAQNCLVFQGAVESIALKHPKERTKVFECISQSREHAEEYDLRKKAMLKAKEDTKFHFKRKKSATLERKQVSQERIEAQKYQDLLDDLHQNCLQLSLAELYFNEKDINALSDSLGEKQLAAAAKNNALLKTEKMVKTSKKGHGRVTREQQHIEKEIRAQEHVLSQCQSQYIKAKVSTSHHMKKEKEACEALKKSQKLIAIKQQELAEERQEISELETIRRNYATQQKKKGTSMERVIELDEDQLEQYKELKERARTKGAVLSQQAEKLHWEVRADNEKMVFDQRRKKEMEDATSQMELDRITARFSSSLQECRQLEESLSAELQQGRNRSEELNQELGQVMEELGNAHLERHESKFQLRRKELLEKLCRVYPESVFGRLSDLCSPVHKTYQLAVIKVFGRYLDAIVVSSENVARDCISYIKEECGGPETFLPINFLDVSPLNARLRELPGAKMMVDVVKINPGRCAGQLKKVLQFVCGNAVVCETVKKARSVAFDGKMRIKAVAQDGTLFTRAGVISGGSSYLRTRAQCWNEKDMLRLKARKDELTAEMRDLMKLKRKDSDLKQAVANAQSAQTRLKYTKAELENIQNNIPKCQTEISRMESELSKLDSQIQIQQDSVEAKDEEMRRIRDQINQMEDTVFHDLCAEIGVDSIRQYEQEHLKHQTELDRKRLEFDNQYTRLNMRLEYEQDQMERQKKKLHIMEQTINKEQRRMAEQKEVLTPCSTRQNVEMVKLQREVMSAETALERKRLFRHNMLLACKIQSLPVTLLSGSLDEISEVQVTLTSATLSIYEREAQLVVDYSSLEPELRSLQAEEEVEAFLEQLEKSVSSIKRVLCHTSVPNMKALAKMKDVKDKLEEVTDAFNDSAKAARKCIQEFEQVKGRRLWLFNRCFEHVCVVIDQIYKRMCRNSSAQAMLSAENPDEPYLGGINYHCVAPGKRFMSMDNLSGGEKAIASLALLFAIHSFRPAPFFILDEVDAALDNTNIGKVTSFIREESRENMQIIVISLKGEFFSKADALLGVYSDFKNCMFSRIVSVDLRRYPLVEENIEAQRNRGIA
uniref:Structural maintenance of chromosomes protein n=1 Tax=Gasterosteus aculeatus aculeatus TaxID=481459 RepID=A0AAQ4PPT2_GASAC